MQKLWGVVGTGWGILSTEGAGHCATRLIIRPCGIFGARHREGFECKCCLWQGALKHWSCLTYESIWQSAYVVVLVTGQDIKFQPEDRGFDIHTACNGIPLISSVSSTHKGLFSGFSQTIWRIIFWSCVFCQNSPNQPFGTWVSQLRKHELTSVNHVSCLYDFLNGVSFFLFIQTFPDLNPYNLIMVHILIWFRF